MFDNTPPVGADITRDNWHHLKESWSRTVLFIIEEEQTRLSNHRSWGFTQST